MLRGNEKLIKNGNNRRGQDATLCSGKTHHFYSVAKEFCLAKLLGKSVRLLSGLLQLLCGQAKLLADRVAFATNFGGGFAKCLTFSSGNNTAQSPHSTKESHSISRVFCFMRFSSFSAGSLPYFGKLRSPLLPPEPPRLPQSVEPA